MVAIKASKNICLLFSSHFLSFLSSLPFAPLTSLLTGPLTKVDHKHPIHSTLFLVHVYISVCVTDNIDNHIYFLSFLEHLFMRGLSILEICIILLMNFDNNKVTYTLHKHCQEFPLHFNLMGSLEQAMN